MILSSLLLIFIGIPMLHKVSMWTLKVFVTSLLMISIAFLVFGCHVVYKGMMNNEGCITRLPSPGEEDQEDKETKADKKDMQALKEEGTKNGDKELSGKGADKEGVKVVMESPIKNGLVGCRVGEAANKEAVKVVAKDAAGNDVEKSGVRKGGCTCNEVKVTKVVAKGEMSRHRG
ncbi:hypothetical protein BZA77DRAFT_386688 [Pyronema omphalodes]|nr:hypothetical protein BZA77DRAFT_386688 [Pyronema omphalodes]